VLWPADRRDLRVRSSRDRIVFADVERERRRRTVSPTIELGRRPWTQSTDARRREPHRVGRGVVHLAGRHTGELVMPVAVGRRSRPYGDDRMLSECADDRDHVEEDRILRPMFERLVERLRETEVEGASEVLASALDAARGKQLLRAEHEWTFDDAGD